MLEPGPVIAADNIIAQERGNLAAIGDIRNELTTTLDLAKPTEASTPGYSPQEIAAMQHERKRAGEAAGLLALRRNFEGGKRETQAGVLQEMAVEENKLRSGEGDFAESLAYLGAEGDADMSLEDLTNLGIKITNKARKNKEARTKIIYGTTAAVGTVYATGAVTAVTMGINTALFTLGGGFGALALGGAVWAGKKLYDSYKEQKAAGATAQQIYSKTGKRPSWDGMGSFRI